MKIFCATFFFASFLVFNSLAQLPDLISIFRGFVEKTRGRFECGYKQLNIPSLDPFFLANYSTSLGTIGDFTNVNISVHNSITVGLSNFQVVSSSYSLLESKLTFSLLHPQLRINGSHATNATLNNESLSGNGTFNVTANNVRLEVAIIFSFFPRFQIMSHVITAASVEQVTAEFNGFADSTKDTRVSQNFSQGSPAWFANNLPHINTELAKIFVGFTNQRLSSFFSFSNVVYAMIIYNPSVPCATS